MISWKEKQTLRPKPIILYQGHTFLSLGDSSLSLCLPVITCHVSRCLLKPTEALWAIVACGSNRLCTGCSSEFFFFPIPGFCPDLTRLGLQDSVGVGRSQKRLFFVEGVFSWEETFYRWRIFLWQWHDESTDADGFNGGENHRPQNTMARCLWGRRTWLRSSVWTPGTSVHSPSQPNIYQDYFLG